MRNFSIVLTAFFAASAFAAPLNLTGTVKDGAGASIKDAVVLLKLDNDLLAYARTLSEANGNFTLLPGKDAPTTPIARPAELFPAKFASYQVMDLKGRVYPANSLPQGIYVLLGKTENGRVFNLGSVYHKGGELKIGEVNQKTKNFAKLVTIDGKDIRLIVRKTGFLPQEVDFENFEQDVGTVVLQRDPLEDRIDSVMKLMTNLDQKIYQMTQRMAGTSANTFGNGSSLYGSVLHGGDTHSGSVLTSMNSALNSYNPKIPVTYGKDMMHGAAAISSATIFPHNIGLGATRDSALVRRACEVTAKESWAGNVDLIFGPAISVPQDQRWGRTYEGFGETPELAVEMGAACVRGYQGEKYNAHWRVISTVKHYLADGSTTNGKDRGNNATISDDELRRIHLPGYEAAVEQGVLSVMASFNQIRGVHQHVDKERMTGWLKTELGFDGYIISDWLGIGNSLSPGTTDANNYSSGGGFGQPITVSPNAINAIRDAINAGIDLAMEPGTDTIFINRLRTLVNNGSVSMDRIDDAVRRILRAKFRAGRMDNPQGVGSSYSGTTGNAANRAVAREAVRKSLVLLKNENNALPISKSSKVYVFGTPANNTGYQCGGWTLGWQGSGTANASGKITSASNVAGSTSIQAGIDLIAPGARVTDPNQADVIVYVTGELPYAEWHGDIDNLNWDDTNISQLNGYKGSKKVITVFISGRARGTSSLMDASHAFVAAWLFGSEGAGVADVLFEGEHNFTGKLPVTWSSAYPYGFGLSY
ncbi:MAG: glycoside hydrolase family 3 protein [Fibromonadales bacterium]|nr:glycoside hydrolase family 3 protein [Fibromonadales bacterium]